MYSGRPAMHYGERGGMDNIPQDRLAKVMARMKMFNEADTNDVQLALLMQKLSQSGQEFEPELQHKRALADIAQQESQHYPENRDIENNSKILSSLGNMGYLMGLVPAERLQSLINQTGSRYGLWQDQGSAAVDPELEAIKEGIKAHSKKK